VTDWKPATRLYEATLRAAARTGFSAHIPQLLVRFGFPGLMTRLEVDPPVEADGALVRAQGLHQTLLRERAEDLEAALAHLGVRHVFAKGITLFGSVYRPGDRLIADIDLYVPRDEIPAAVMALESQGYWRLPDEYQAGPPALRSTMSYERSGTTEMDSAAVDLHWALDPVTRLLPRPHQDLPAAVWETARNGGGLTVPDPELHAAILAHHLVDTDLLHVRSLLDLVFVFHMMHDDGGSAYHAACVELGIGPFGAMLAHFIRTEFDVERPAAAGGLPRGWNAFTRRLTLEGWLEIVAQAPPDADDAITMTRIRRRLRLVRRATVPVMMDVLFPPRAWLAWRWQPGSLVRARARHYRGLARKVLGISPAHREAEE